MMRNTLFTALAALTLASTSYAQFTFKTFDGKTIGTKAAPTFRSLYLDSDGSMKPESETYFLWEKDHVNILVTEKSREQGRTGIIFIVKEYHFFYDLFDDKKMESIENGNHIRYKGIFEDKKKQIPYHIYFDDQSKGGMEESFEIKFPGKNEINAFVEKMNEKKFDLALDLDYTPDLKSRIIAEYDTKYDAAPSPVVKEDATPKSPIPGSPTPAPAPKPTPKAKEEVVVKLYNKSNNPIELVVKSPGGSSRTIFTINQRNSRRMTLKVGSEVLAKASGAVLFTVTEKMDDTEQVIAK